MAIVARFHPSGTEFHGGIPAKNLDEDEFNALSKEDQAVVRSSPLYTMVSDDHPKADAPKAEAKH